MLPKARNRDRLAIARAQIRALDHNLRNIRMLGLPYHTAAGGRIPRRRSRAENHVSLVR